jgi:hypothetical protein
VRCSVQGVEMSRSKKREGHEHVTFCLQATQRLVAEPSAPSASNILDFLELMDNLKVRHRRPVPSASKGSFMISGTNGYARR